jgi:hypothetical protein
LAVSIASVKFYIFGCTNIKTVAAVVKTVPFPRFGVGVLRPIHLLGADDVTPAEIALSETPEQREELATQIPASVAWIYRFWQPYRQTVTERMVAATIQRFQP